MRIATKTYMIAAVVEKKKQVVEVSITSIVTIVDT